MTGFGFVAIGFPLISDKPGLLINETSPLAGSSFIFTGVFLSRNDEILIQVKKNQEEPYRMQKSKNSLYYFHGKISPVLIGLGVITSLPLASANQRPR